MAEQTNVSPAERIRARRRQSRGRLWTIVTNDKIGLTGLIVVTLTVIAAAFAPWLAPFGPRAMSTGNRLEPPGPVFLLGADEAGRDLLSRAIFGTRTSLTVSVTVVVLAALIGVTLGLYSAYYKGMLDGVTMRFMDIIFAFPTLLLALAVVATLGPQIPNLILALTIVFIPSFARVTRGAALAVGAEPYVEAARSVGISNARIIWKYILPNALAPIAVQFTISIANAILVEASLGYLGLGVPPPTPSWGAMLASGQAFIEVSIWPSLVPGLFIMMTVLGFNLFGDALRDSLDPRLRARM